MWRYENRNFRFFIRIERFDFLTHLDTWTWKSHNIHISSVLCHIGIVVEQDWNLFYVDNISCWRNGRKVHSVSKTAEYSEWGKRTKEKQQFILIGMTRRRLFRSQSPFRWHWHIRKPRISYFISSLTRWIFFCELFKINFFYISSLLLKIKWYHDNCHRKLLDFLARLTDNSTRQWVEIVVGGIGENFSFLSYLFHP